MIGGILVQSKRYSCLDYVSVSLMTVGLIWFTSIDRSLNAQFNFTGVILISMALCVDAFLGNFQAEIQQDKSNVLQENLNFFSTEMCFHQLSSLLITLI